MLWLRGAGRGGQDVSDRQGERQRRSYRSRPWGATTHHFGHSMLLRGCAQCPSAGPRQRHISPVGDCRGSRTHQCRVRVKVLRHTGRLPVRACARAREREGGERFEVRVALTHEGAVRKEGSGGGGSLCRDDEVVLVNAGVVRLFLVLAVAARVEEDVVDLVLLRGLESARGSTGERERRG